MSQTEDPRITTVRDQITEPPSGPSDELRALAALDSLAADLQRLQRENEVLIEQFDVAVQAYQERERTR